jgi:hypothetical protein
MDDEKFYEAKRTLYIYSEEPSWETIKKKYNKMYPTATAYRKPLIKEAYDYLFKLYKKDKNKKVRFSFVEEAKVPYEPRKLANYEELVSKKKQVKKEQRYSKDPMYVELREEKLKAMRTARKNSPYYQRYSIRFADVDEPTTIKQFKNLNTKYIKTLAEVYDNVGKPTGKIRKPPKLKERIRIEYDTENLQDEKKKEIFDFSKPSPPAVQPLKSYVKYTFG